MVSLHKLWGILLMGLSSTCLGANLANNLHDPTQPPNEVIAKQARPNKSNEADGDTKIDAIFSGKKIKKAIINDHIFYVGDKLADATITAIDIDGITLQNDDGSKFILPISKATIKIPITKKQEGNP